MEIQDACLSQRSGQELLIEFKQTRRQEPFEEIVRRYGGMVYGVCFQITRNRHDAEDATQAVFLALAMECKREQDIKYLGPWLQQVAKRMSLDVKRSKSRREKRERDYNDSGNNQNPQPDGSHQLTREELNEILRDEVNQLPAKYRLPLILHYFGGMSQTEMAREIGCNSNTLSVRLFRGRDLLSKCLARRGITVAGATLAALLAETIRSAVSSSMMASTASAATHVAGGHAATVAIPAHLLALASGVGATAPAWHVMKFSFLVVLLVGSAIAGAPEALRQISNFNLPASFQFDSTRLFKRLFQSFVPQPQFSAVTSAIEEDAGDLNAEATSKIDAALPSGRWVDVKSSRRSAVVPNVKGVGSSPHGRGAVSKFTLPNRGIQTAPIARRSTPTYHVPSPVQVARSETPPASRGQLSNRGRGRNESDSSGVRIFVSTDEWADTRSSAPLKVPQPSGISSKPKPDPMGVLSSLGEVGPSLDYVRADLSGMDTAQYSTAVIPETKRARMILRGAGSDGDATITTSGLYDESFPKFPPEHTLVEAWKVEETIEFARADLRVEYDQVTVDAMELSEPNLKLWVYDGQWVRLVDSSFGRDMTRDMLWGSARDGFTFIAVSAPEPTGILAILMTASALVLRRRRPPVPSPGGRGSQARDRVKSS